MLKKFEFHLFSKVQIHVRANVLQLPNDLINILHDFNAVERLDIVGNSVGSRYVLELLDKYLLGGWQLNHPAEQIFIFYNSIKNIPQFILLNGLADDTKPLQQHCHVECKHEVESQ